MLLVDEDKLWVKTLSKYRLFGEYLSPNKKESSLSTGLFNPFPSSKSLPLECGENLTVGIDSTELKVYGEGEWKVRKHGSSKRSKWRKLYICIDFDTQKILSVELTGNREDDAAVGKRMSGGKNDSYKRI
jgi:hypothetical protein